MGQSECHLDCKRRDGMRPRGNRRVELNGTSFLAITQGQSYCSRVQAGSNPPGSLIGALILAMPLLWVRGAKGHIKFASGGSDAAKNVTENYTRAFTKDERAAAEKVG